MNATSKNLSIIAFYLSEYSEQALKELGYSTYTKAFSELSALFSRDNNYLKLRRDEFDALPESKSRRVGWRNRPAIKTVVDMAEHLRKFSFEELTELVVALIENAIDPYQTDAANESDAIGPEEAEEAFNKADPTSRIIIKTAEHKVRHYDTRIIASLKKLYNNRCQICGCTCGEEYGVRVAQAHHIEFFSETQNNDSDNIMIVCPNHHAIIHAAKPEFFRDKLSYIFPNGAEETLALNYHL